MSKMSQLDLDVKTLCEKIDRAKARLTNAEQCALGDDPLTRMYRELRCAESVIADAVTYAARSVQDYEHIRRRIKRLHANSRVGGDSGTLRLAMANVGIDAPTFDRIFSEPRKGDTRRIKLWNALTIAEAPLRKKAALEAELRKLFGSRFISAELQKQDKRANSPMYSYVVKVNGQHTYRRKK